MRCFEQRAAHMMAILKENNIPNWDKVSVEDLCKMHARLQRGTRSGTLTDSREWKYKPAVPTPVRESYSTRQAYRLACRLAEKNRTT